MTEYAYWRLSTPTPISLQPGDVRIYRLPAMMPGEFRLTTAQQVIPPPGQPGQPGDPGQPGTDGIPGQPTPVHRTTQPLGGIGGRFVASGPILRAPGNGGGGAGSTPIGDLMIDLLHGDELVASGTNSLPLQQTPSDGDDTWRVRMQLAPNTSAGTYNYGVDLMFPSVLPILTRRIPLAFFQQGFDNNWNGRNYISISFEENNLLIHFDPELATYYHLSDKDFVMDSHFLVTLPNIMVRDIRLSINSSAGGNAGNPRPMTYVRLSVSFTGINGQPMSGSAYGIDINVHDFSINFNFFLTTIPGIVGDVMGTNVGYVCEVDTDFGSQIYDTNGEVEEEVSGKVHDALKGAENFLNLHAEPVGAALTPWLLGAGFDVWNVYYDPNSSQPVPPPPSPQGDIVIEYVGQAPAASSDGLVAAPDPPSILTITTSAVANGVVGQPYSQQLAAVGGTAPYIWTLAGTIPPGMTFAGDTLSGAPAAPGAYSLQASVQDSLGAHISRAYTLAINPVGLSITTPSPMPDGVAGEPYAAVMAVQGGSAPHHWSATGLPEGLSMSATGVISGVPSGNGSASTIVVLVTDAQAVSAWSPLQLTLHDAPLFPGSIYTPRGDGDTIWKPLAHPAPLGGGLPGPLSPATTPGDLNKVDHIVVVMMENRSFDHMLGYLSREGGRSDVEGLKWENDANRTQFNYYNGRFYYPVRLFNTGVFTSEAVSPDHSHESVRSQMADGMNHFVSDFAKKKVGDDPAMLQLVMGYYAGHELPTYDMLAREYAICDHWFCSHVGPTWPNRFVTLTGDLNRDSYGEPEVDTPLYTDFTPSEMPTLFDHLTARGVSWQYFQQRASVMRAFTKYSFDLVNVLEYSDPAKGFIAAAKAGLASVTFIDPLFGDLPAGVNSPQDNDDAPPSDLKDGQRFIAEIVSTLLNPDSNPNWMRTMLIIVYDEHGGFYDHVQPPDNATPLLGQNSGKLGPRVPAFVVSPWTPAGLVLKETFDHGTIAATILRRFCSPHPPSMGARVAAARDLRGALPLSTARGGRRVPLPTPPAPTGSIARRIAPRPFKAPRANDSFGSLLGGIALTLGSTPE
jgi:phospholipase C